MRAKRSAKAITAPMPVVRSGLDALFDTEYEPMYRLAFAMLGSDRDAEEIVQDAFLAIGRRWESLDNPGGYLRVSVVNGARKQIRSRIRSANAEKRIRATVSSSSADDDSYLLDVLDALPERQRVAVVLTYYSGLNSTEVGELLDCPPATVRSLVSRALAQLRKEMTQ